MADSCSTFIAHTRVALSGPLLVVGFIARHDLLLKFTSNMIKYPKNKGIALNLAGPQGAGKSTLVNLLRKLLGKAKVIETTTPEEHVWGQFNSPMTLAVLVVLSEVSGKNFVSAAGKLKAIISDPPLMINKKGIPQVEVTSFHRVLGATNHHGVCPLNEPGNRRWQDLKCSDEWAHLSPDGQKTLGYFVELHALFENEDVLRTVWAILKWRRCPEKLTIVDLFESEYDQEMKSMNMPPEKQFIKWLVDDTKNAYSEDELPFYPVSCPQQEELKLDSARMWGRFKAFCIYANLPNIYAEPRFKKVISAESLGLERHGYSKKRDRVEGAARGGAGSHWSPYTLHVPRLRKYFGLDGAGDGAGSSTDGAASADGSAMEGTGGGSNDAAGEGTPSSYGPHCPLYIREVNAFFEFLATQPQDVISSAGAGGGAGGGGGGFEKTGDLSNKSEAFKAEVQERLNEWRVSTLATATYAHTIPADRTNEQRHKIIKELEREWEEQGRPWSEERASPAHPASPAGSGGAGSSSGGGIGDLLGGLLGGGNGNSNSGGGIGDLLGGLLGGGSGGNANSGGLGDLLGGLLGGKK